MNKIKTVNDKKGFNLMQFTSTLKKSRYLYFYLDNYNTPRLF